MPAEYAGMTELTVNGCTKTNCRTLRVDLIGQILGHSPQIALQYYQRFSTDDFDITPRESVSPHLFAMSREVAVAGIAPPALGCKPAPTRAGHPTTPSPPIANRGVTLYTDTDPDSVSRGTNPDVSPTHQRIMGGYDGGVEVGFNGKWRSQTFERLTLRLEKAREQAQIKRGDPAIELDGFKFQMQPHGGGKGVHYRYILAAGGTQVLIHATPEGDLQPLRIRYGAEALIGRSLFAVHERFRGWLDAIGFEVEKEVVSRVDLQVMVERPVGEFFPLQLSPYFRYTSYIFRVTHIVNSYRGTLCWTKNIFAKYHFRTN